MSNEIKRFEMQAPHGARVFPSMTGCIIEYIDELRPAVEAWLTAEAVRFGQVSTEEIDLVTCPKCHGDLEMRDGIPIYCPLCHGRGKVSRLTAQSYSKSLTQKQTIVRKQQFDDGNQVETVRPGHGGSPPPISHHDQLRMVIDRQTNQSAVPNRIPLNQMALEEMIPGKTYSTTSIVTDDDDFVAPRPGEPGFIGPIQQ